MRDEDVLTTIEISTELLLASVALMTDEQVGEESLLPDWTRGHVLTHVARAGDSLGRLLDWARTGVEQPQYASLAARDAEIEAGAGRGIAELAADVRASGDAFEARVRALPVEAWEVPVRTRTGEVCTAGRVVFIRLRELEVHHVDLDAGYRFADIPVEVATAVIDDILSAVGARQGREAVAPVRLAATDVEVERELGVGGPLVTGSQAELLGWLSGRLDGSGLTVVGADQVPAAPHWL